MEFEDVFDNICRSCEKQQQLLFSSKQDAKLKKDYDSFLNKYAKLLATTNNTPSKLIKSEQVTLIKQLAKLINCIGCRSSIERFYKQLATAKSAASDQSTGKNNSFDL